MDDVAPGMGEIGNGKTTNDTLPRLQGTATAGAGDYLSKWRVYRHGHRRCGFRRMELSVAVSR